MYIYEFCMHIIYHSSLLFFNKPQAYSLWGMIPELFLKTSLEGYTTFPGNWIIFKELEDKRVGHFYYPPYFCLLPWVNTPCELHHMGEKDPSSRIGWTHLESSRKKKGGAWVPIQKYVLFFSLCVGFPEKRWTSAEEDPELPAQCRGRRYNSSAEVPLPTPKVILGGKWKLFILLGVDSFVISINISLGSYPTT